MNTQNSGTIASVAPPEKRTGLIEHVALSRWNQEASQEATDSALAELRKLKDKIPGIVDISSAANFSERAKGYTHVLIIRFTDRSALQAFGPHPEHQRVVKNFVIPIRADSLVLDYELWIRQKQIEPKVPRTKTVKGKELDYECDASVRRKHHDSAREIALHSQGPHDRWPGGRRVPYF